MRSGEIPSKSIDELIAESERLIELSRAARQRVSEAYGKILANRPPVGWEQELERQRKQREES